MIKKIFIFFSFIISIGCSYLRPAANLSSIKVIPENIRKIKLNMKKDEVIEILGQPFSLEPYLTKYYGKSTSIMLYSKSLKNKAVFYPMIWILLKNDEVNEVYVKRYIYWGVDDYCVYLLSKDTKFEREDYMDTLK